MIIRSLKKCCRRFIFLVFILIGIPVILMSQNTRPPGCYGGKRLMKEFLEEEMVYPREALEKGIEGKVELKFIVHEDGSVSDIQVIESVSEDIDAEAVRLLKKILWHPATEIGKPVAEVHWLDIQFKIKKYEKWVRQRGYDQYSYPYEPVDTSGKVYKREEIDQHPKPVFNSLDRDLGHFISSNLAYPEAAFRANVSGTVKLRFVVEPSGRISNIETIEAVGGGCTEEAIRVVKLIKWRPGIKEEMAVRTCLPLEITFDISKKTVGGGIPNPGQLH